MTTARASHSSVREFFLYLASAIALYASVFSLLGMLFDVINAYFRDVLDYGFDPYASSLRPAIATLVILFPIYLVLVRFVTRQRARHPELGMLAVRKWLTYVTLFLAGSAIVVDLIVLINTFLGGEVTLRFILKVLAVLVVATWTFIYYYYDLKDKWATRKIALKALAICASAFVLASIVLAFSVVGSPKTQRLLRIDNQKVTDLQSIQWQIINFWQQKGKLPEGLDALNDPLSGFSLPRDPETNLGKMYTYAVTEKHTFEICADFNLPTPKTASTHSLQAGVPIADTVSNDGVYRSGMNENWDHTAGVFCYKRVIDPDLYPIIKK